VSKTYNEYNNKLKIRSTINQLYYYNKNIGCEFMKGLVESQVGYRELAEKYEAINRRLEERLQQEIAKNKEKDLLLIQQSRLAAMGEMITTIGQQWRRPLKNLSHLIQDVKEADEFGEIDGQFVDRFTRESMLQINLMSRAINDFRKFYKPDHEKSTFSVGDAIEDALFIFSQSLKDHGIEVEFEYRGQQPAFGYPNEFSQAVLHILTNARDEFVESGSNNRVLVIKITETEQFIISEFTNNAGGIEPSLMHAIFAPYFTTKPHGTGLGLYMTKKIMENMNGQVSVENTGDGARFTLSVPKVKAAIKTEF
jgi:signal transduction histidine kinase